MNKIKNIENRPRKRGNRNLIKLLACMGVFRLILIDPAQSMDDGRKIASPTDTALPPNECSFHAFVDSLPPTDALREEALGLFYGPAGLSSAERGRRIDQFGDTVALAYFNANFLRWAIQVADHFRFGHRVGAPFDSLAHLIGLRLLAFLAAQSHNPSPSFLNSQLSLFLGQGDASSVDRLHAALIQELAVLLHVIHSDGWEGRDALTGIDPSRLARTMGLSDASRRALLAVDLHSSGEATSEISPLLRNVSTVSDLPSHRSLLAKLSKLDSETLSQHKGTWQLPRHWQGLRERLEQIATLCNPSVDVRLIRLAIADSLAGLHRLLSLSPSNQPALTNPVLAAALAPFVYKYLLSPFRNTPGHVSFAPIPQLPPTKGPSRMMRWHIAKVAEQHKEIVALRKEQKRKDVAHQEFVARSDQERHRLNQLIHDLSGRAAHFEAVAADLTRREACVGQQYTALNVGYATLRQQYEEITRRLAAVQLQYDEARRRYEECMARNQTLHARLNQAHAELDQARGIPPYPRAPSSLSQYG